MMLLVLFIPLLIGWLLPINFPALLGIGLMPGIAGASFAVALPLASHWYPPERQGVLDTCKNYVFPGPRFSPARRRAGKRARLLLLGKLIDQYNRGTSSTKHDLYDLNIQVILPTYATKEVAPLSPYIALKTPKTYPTQTIVNQGFIHLLVLLVIEYNSNLTALASWCVYRLHITPVAMLLAALHAASTNSALARDGMG